MYENAKQHVVTCRLKHILQLKICSSSLELTYLEESFVVVVSFRNGINLFIKILKVVVCLFCFSFKTLLYSKLKI